MTQTADAANKQSAEGSATYWPEPQLTLRDKMAAACLPAIYAQFSQLTDRAAELAYEQADEMLKARDRHYGDGGVSK